MNMKVSLSNTLPECCRKVSSSEEKIISTEVINRNNYNFRNQIPNSDVYNSLESSQSLENVHSTLEYGSLESEIQSTNFLTFYNNSPNISSSYQLIDIHHDTIHSSEDFEIQDSAYFNERNDCRSNYKTSQPISSSVNEFQASDQYLVSSSSNFSGPYHQAVSENEADSTFCNCELEEGITSFDYNVSTSENVFSLGCCDDGNNVEGTITTSGQEVNEEEMHELLSPAVNENCKKLPHSKLKFTRVRKFQYELFKKKFPYEKSEGNSSDYMKQRNFEISTEKCLSNHNLKSNLDFCNNNSDYSDGKNNDNLSIERYCPFFHKTFLDDNPLIFQSPYLYFFIQSIKCDSSESSEYGLFAKQTIYEKTLFGPIKYLNFEKVNSVKFEKFHSLQFTKTIDINSLIFQDDIEAMKENFVSSSFLIGNDVSEEMEKSYEKYKVHINDNNKESAYFPEINENTLNEKNSCYKAGGDFQNFNKFIPIGNVNGEPDNKMKTKNIITSAIILSREKQTTSPCEEEFLCSDVNLLSNSIKDFKFSCSHCSLNFGNMDEFMKHSIKHKNELNIDHFVKKELPYKKSSAKKYKCLICYKSFSSSDSLKKHALVHGSEEAKPLQCTVCLKRFLTNSALACHVKTHSTGKITYECPLCHETFQLINKLREHVTVHKKGDQYCCPKCGKIFDSYSRIRKHVRSFHSNRHYPCQFCNKVFLQSDRLKNHLLRHSDHREFLCAICGRQFKRKDKLKEHTKRLHSPEKETQREIETISQQNRKFFRKMSSSDYHRFIYKCHSCLLGFKRRGMLVNHLAKRHPHIQLETVPELNLPILKTTRDYYCQYCDKVYKSSSKRKVHILKNHPGADLPLSNRKIKENLDIPGIPNPSFSQTVGSISLQPHSCPWCHRQYASRAKLLQHQRKKHINCLPEVEQVPRNKLKIENGLKCLAETYKHKHKFDNLSEKLDLPNDSNHNNTYSIGIEVESRISTISEYQNSQQMDFPNMSESHKSYDYKDNPIRFMDADLLTQAMSELTHSLEYRTVSISLNGTEHLFRISPMSSASEIVITSELNNIGVNTKKYNHIDVQCDMHNNLEEIENHFYQNNFSNILSDSSYNHLNQELCDLSTQTCAQTVLPLTRTLSDSVPAFVD